MYSDKQTESSKVFINIVTCILYIEESGKNILFILYVDFKGLSNVNAWPSVNAKHTLFFVVT